VQGLFDVGYNKESATLAVADSLLIILLKYQFQSPEMSFATAGFAFLSAKGIGNSTFLA